MKQNSNSALLAALLKDARVGTFTGLIITKKGTEKGRGADRKTYGDDRVHVTILTGFSYPNLVKRSAAALEGIDPVAFHEAHEAKQALKGESPRFSLEDVKEAIAELKESFSKTLDGTSESTTEHVYEPLVVDGETVRGARVYKCVAGSGVRCHCRDCTGDAKAPRTGTIYLQGLKIHETVIEAAANGPAPAANSSSKTLAKDAIRATLPIRRYVSYSLEPGTDFFLRAGGTAAIEAEARGFVVTDEILDVIERVA